jgi:hypothetical protein
MPTMAKSPLRRAYSSTAKPARLHCRNAYLGEHLRGRERRGEQRVEQIVGSDDALAGRSGHDDRPVKR